MQLSSCPCLPHQHIYETWPQKNAKLHISTCMKYCIYCIKDGNAKKFETAALLRRHLRTTKYQKRNLVITTQAAGRLGVQDPDYTCLEPSCQRPKPNSGALHTDEDSHTSRKSFCTHNTPFNHDKDSTIAPYLQLSTANTIQECISSMIGFDEDVLELLASLDLLSWADICQKTKDGDVTNWPRIFKADQCWKSGPPKINDLFRETIVSPANDPSIEYRRGEADPNVDPLRAVAQSFINPEPLDPVFLTGLRLPSVSDNTFLVPEELSRYVEPFDEENVQLHLTPHFCNVGLHIDPTDGISATLGKCIKIWLLFAPPNHNLKLMRSVEGHKQKLMRIGRLLKEGYIIKTTSAVGIYIPTGWSHETFTIQGGFLVAKDFTTSSSALPMSRYLSSGLDQWLTLDNQEMCFEWYSKCLERSLYNHHTSEALNAWIQSRERIVELGKAPPEWARRWLQRVKRIWDDFWGSQDDRPATCLCGEATESLPRHFRAVHLSMLDPRRYKRKRSKRSIMK